MSRREDILESEGVQFPGRTYTEVVLQPAYDSAKENLLDSMIAVNKAHLIMLVEQSLISLEDALQIANAIKHLNLHALRTGHYSGQFEDLFFEVEDAIMKETGEVGGSLHLARSRNDMGVAMYRLTLRPKIQKVIQSLLNFQSVLLDLAEEHAETVMLGYTHTQQAQPTTLAHYLLAVHDSVSRDYKRFQSAYQIVNLSPLGAAALTTTGFNINRHRVAALLGFSDLVENSYDAVCASDYLGETATAIHLTLTDMGRYIQDFLLWSTQEFGALRIANPYVQISSIMPQKRNPVSFEHLRALSSSGVGRAATVLQMLHNTPFGDIVDTEDDLQPHLWAALGLTDQIFRLLSAVLGTVEVNRALLLERAQRSFASVTELADTLVRVANLPFRKAHSVASAVVKLALSKGLDATGVSSELVDEAAVSVLGTPIGLGESVVRTAMDPVGFVAIRKQIGGPAPTEIRRSIARRREVLEGHLREVNAEISQTEACLSSLDAQLATWGSEQ